MVGFEKEITSILRKMESRKGCGLKVSRASRNFSSTYLEREIQKLEWLVKYNCSPHSIRGKGGAMGF